VRCDRREIWWRHQSLRHVQAHQVEGDMTVKAGLAADGKGGVPGETRSSAPSEI